MLLPDSPEDEEREENDAEHSWSLALVACTMAPHIDEKLDVGLVAQFAIVHDLVEIYADDVSVWAHESALAAKEENEAKALRKFKKEFAHFPWLVNTLLRYEAQSTDEARFVKSIDKYLAISLRFMDGGRLFKKRGITKETFSKKIQTPLRKARGHASAAEYYEHVLALYEQHPEHFAPPSTRGQDTTA